MIAPLALEIGATTFAGLVWGAILLVVMTALYVLTVTLAEK